MYDRSCKFDNDWNYDYQQNSSDNSKDAKLFLLARNMLLLGLNQVLVSGVDVFIGLIDVLLSDI